MLCYWILRRPDGTPAGLVRADNDRVLLQPSGSIAGTFTLFSDSDAIPIVPESEVHLCGAAAVLGTDRGQTTCFAASPGAKPLAYYRERLSRICTIKTTPVETDPVRAESSDDMSRNSTFNEEKKEDVPSSADSMSRNNTIETGSISESAREAQAFSALLQHADAFYSAFEADPPMPDVDNLVQKVDKQGESGIELFVQEYPGARWRYVDGTNVLPHYEGTWKQPGGQTMHILAVRGRAAPRPPRALFGFTRFLRDRDGTGYWLRLTPLP